MAVDKLVDSTKLDAALEATADAIREKTGDSADIDFDLATETGFAEAVEAIPSGETVYYTNDGVPYVKNMIIPHNVTKFIARYLYSEADQMESIFFPNSITNWSTHMIASNKSIKKVEFEEGVTTFGQSYMVDAKPDVIIIPSTFRVLPNSALRDAYLSKIGVLDLKNTDTIEDYAVWRSGLTGIILRSNTVCALTGTHFIEADTFRVYVPSALVNSYKGATNWSDHADKIVAIEEYPEITGGVI